MMLIPILLSFLTVISASRHVLESRKADHPKVCTIESKYAASSGTADDSPAVASAFASCAHDSTIVFSEGVDYNIFTPISAKNLSNVTIKMEGNLYLPQDVAFIQNIVKKSNAQRHANSQYWFTFSGPSIHYVGTGNVSAGWINSHGQAWWDANPVDGTGLENRPHLFYFNTTHGSMKHFKSRKPIAWNVQLHGHNISISNTVIDAYSNTSAFPFNTNGFEVSATNVKIKDSVIFNGDDAIAIQSGSHNVVFEGGTIGYRSHGMSIGSLGQDPAVFANVSNIHFSDITVANALYAARFKSYAGGQGIAKHITWSNIRTYNVTFPIFVTQSYHDQDKTKAKLPSNAAGDHPANSSVVMEDFKWSSFTGTINTYAPGDGSCVSDPCWYNAGLPDLKHTEAIIIECETDRSCKNFELEEIQLFPQSLQAPTVVCVDATAALNPKLGFVCANGPFIPT